MTDERISQEDQYADFQGSTLWIYKKETRAAALYLQSKHAICSLSVWMQQRGVTRRGTDFKKTKTNADISQSVQEILSAAL